MSLVTSRVALARDAIRRARSTLEARPDTPARQMLVERLAAYEREVMTWPDDEPTDEESHAMTAAIRRLHRDAEALPVRFP